METYNVRPHTRHFIRLLAVLAASLSLLAAGVQTSSALDVYTTPGKHHQNGRDWLTSCEKYSSVVDRCTTQIWHKTVTYKNGTFTAKTQWTFNNLTYKTSPRAAWAPFNALVTPGEHTLNGRRWKTECDTAWTGSNGCRSQIWATVPEYRNGRYEMVNKWVFNNIVHVTPIKCPVPQSQIRTLTGQPSIVTSACTVSKSNSKWLAADYVVSNPSGKLYRETAFFFQRPTGWGLEFKSNENLTSVCAELYRQSGAPLDLAEPIKYCFKG
ncbi:hypothetical protein [Tessaracoccus antarcticus]|uniref:Uncharacterized protein n=1 Tax=Tessaracoccus antarcticus TaxID=2479848 RepID=A0A3M0G6C3_9ACTN|nr:hypothetical protein [Tessaracoccus antarcticus]RMB60038.1 hypothetical protein EAX62_10010 [Tessaracoccus antarcticus]